MYIYLKIQNNLKHVKQVQMNVFLKIIQQKQEELFLAVSLTSTEK